MERFLNDFITVGDLKIAKPEDKLDDWTVVKQQSMKYVKGDVIVEKFNKDFPHAKVNNYELICDLASRSRKISEWLVNANVTYSELAEMPLYLEGLVEPKTYKSLTSDILQINRTIGSFSQQRQELAEKYKNELKRLDKKENETINLIKGKNKILKVLTLNTTSLPLTLQLMISGYSPANSLNVQESQKIYAREMLINYKVTLIKKIISNEDIDIDAIIEESQLK